jgi:hypothetical protein
VPEASDPQPGRRQQNVRADWYSLKVDTLRGLLIFLFVVGLLVVGFVGYQFTRNISLGRQATIVIDEAEFLLGRVQSEGVASTSGGYEEAWQNLQQARRQLAEGEHEEALISARWSRNLLSSMLDDLRDQAPSGEAQFVGVQGGVEFRRGDGPWQVARNRLVLRSGDYVKTAGSGSAEVEFSDGTSFRVRPNTVILINQRSGDATRGPTEESVSLEYGWVNLDTTDRPSRVVTPEAEARVAESSQVELSYERARRRSTFSSFQGSMEVRTNVGTFRRLGSMEQLVHTAEGLSAPVRLPDSPELLAPENERVFDLADEQLILRWERVEGAERYGLQICRDGHFVENIIDVENRTSTVATVGLLGEGRFLWRVAAFTRHGNKGPWSDPGVFVVESGRADSGRTAGAATR